MHDIPDKAPGQHPPASTSATGHPLPRRASPENSITLRHHRLARDASMKAANSVRAPSSLANIEPTSSPGRNSTGDTHGIGLSDAKEWFEQSNENPTALFSQAMDVDPPFFQKETDSSNEDLSKDASVFPYHLRAGAPLALKPAVTHSSSTGDYRSVIDDLTIEIQRLKEELKRYKQVGPDMLKRDKLFEIKVHGLPKRKKRELEEKLRDFAANLEENTSAQASSARKKSSRHTNRQYSGSGSMSKHASSSSGSHSRPADSAYASMSTGQHSSGTSLGRPSMSSRVRTSEHKVESYLKDIPEGLYPRHVVITEKEKKKIVVRRLEQLFTGKITGRGLNRNLPPTGTALGSVVAEAQTGSAATIQQPPILLPEAVREARILATDGTLKKSRSRDNTSASQSNDDQTESGGNVVGSGDANTSPPNAPPPEQRATRPRDLDPDRIQVPLDNMNYIRHLGLSPPELILASKGTTDVSPDADGWVYLNLLCSLAQLHMINVTPDFIRHAVSEKSTKFLLSPDGRKIRWRGGTDGTKFSSDSSGENSQESPYSDDTDGSNKDGRRKKAKTQQPSGGLILADSSKKPWKLGPQVSGSSESFHYKPLFVRQSSSYEHTSFDGTGSSVGVAEESYAGGESRLSGTASSQRRKRRLDGAIIYYSGAAFCTDLSGDTGDISPTTYMASSGQQQSASIEFVRPALPFRTTSGSYLSFRPLSDGNLELHQALVVNSQNLAMNKMESDDDLEADFPWSDSKQPSDVVHLEPCGLGGVLPDDHFTVAVTTRRRKENGSMTESSHTHRRMIDVGTGSIIRRLAFMSTSSPRALPSAPRSCSESSAVEIEYVSGRVKRLEPAPLPPPALFFPPFSTDSSATSDEDSESEVDYELPLSERFATRRANPHHSELASYPDGVDMSSGDEDGEEPDDEDESEDDHSEVRDMEMPIPRKGTPRHDSSAAAGPVTGRIKSLSVEAVLARTVSSVATAGDRDAESGYSSSVEESG